MRTLWRLIAAVLVLVALVESIKTPRNGKGRSLSIKVPDTLSTSATGGYDDYADFNMVSSDPHHVSYIVQNRLYYHRIPHQRIVLNQEDIREMNGLPRHLLESIRPFFPFFIDY